MKYLLALIVALSAVSSWGYSFSCNSYNSRFQFEVISPEPPGSSYSLEVYDRFLYQKNRKVADLGNVFHVLNEEYFEFNASMRDEGQKLAGMAAIMDVPVKEIKNISLELRFHNPVVAAPRNRVVKGYLSLYLGNEKSQKYELSCKMKL